MSQNWEDSCASISLAKTWSLPFCNIWQNITATVTSNWIGIQYGICSIHYNPWGEIENARGAGGKKRGWPVGLVGYVLKCLEVLLAAEALHLAHVALVQPPLERPVVLPFEFLQDPEVRCSDPEALTKRPASATLRSDPSASWIDPPQDLMRADDGEAVHPQVTMSST